MQHMFLIVERPLYKACFHTDFILGSLLNSKASFSSKQIKATPKFNGCIQNTLSHTNRVGTYWHGFPFLYRSTLQVHGLFQKVTLKLQINTLKKYHRTTIITPQIASDCRPPKTSPHRLFGCLLAPATTSDSPVSSFCLNHKHDSPSLSPPPTS